MSCNRTGTEQQTANNIATAASTPVQLSRGSRASLKRGRGRDPRLPAGGAPSGAKGPDDKTSRYLTRRCRLPHQRRLQGSSIVHAQPKSLASPPANSWEEVTLAIGA